MNLQHRTRQINRRRPILFAADLHVRFAWGPAKAGGYWARDDLLPSMHASFSSQPANKIVSKRIEEAVIGGSEQLHD
jgi:hypothetical protein